MMVGKNLIVLLGQKYEKYSCVVLCSHRVYSRLNKNIICSLNRFFFWQKYW